jgi:hypothetical protein
MILPQPNTTAQPLNQVTQDFQLQGGKVKTDDSALAVVIQSTERAEKFIMARLWLSEWRTAKQMYDAPSRQKYWRDTRTPRSNNSFPLIKQHVAAILDQTLPALFPEATPFAIKPNEGTPAQVARAWENIISYQLKEARVKQTCRLILKDALIFGTGLGKIGFESYDRKRIMYKHAVMPTEIKSPTGGPSTWLDTKESDELVEYEIDERISHPIFKRVEINHLLVAPNLRSPDVREAEYVVYRDYVTVRDLAKLRDFEGYDIPSDEELRAIATMPEEQAPSSVMETESTAYPTQGHRALPRYLDAGADPLDHKLEILEYWTNDTVIVVLQRKKVIRNMRNPMGIIPFVSCFWDDIPGTFYSYGIPRRIGGIQTHIQGLRNKRMDDINLNLQNMWKVKKGDNIAAQPIKAYPGAVFKVTDMDSMEPLMKQPVLAEAYKEEDVLVADAEKTTGANELAVQGGSSAAGRGTGMRTAAGASAVAGASSNRIQSFVDICADQVLVPVLYSFLKMDRQWLEPSKMRQIVGKTLWAALQQESNGNLLVDMTNNSDIEFTMLAGSNLAAKQKMAQSLPLQGQIYGLPAVQAGLAAAGLKVNWVEYSRRMEQSTGWDSQDDIIIPQTDQDKQAAMQSNPKVLDMKATQARLAQMHSNAKDLSAQEHQQKMQQSSSAALDNTSQIILTKALERQQEKAEAPELAGGLGGE